MALLDGSLDLLLMLGRELVEAIQSIEVKLLVILFVGDGRFDVQKHTRRGAAPREGVIK